ncbi:hypothetical protein FA95DRAFT_1597317 [Auriscalpium vulgare]|uniref:Uncharacterized protein n=1 Tax=Auriscalpium vulgare TaxID=40419 RepID=A0ACB8RKU1_9AGAM|nr:hypothetical protein FA95DRAFT_1597317 [Auriscalpium vulgare]
MSDDPVADKSGFLCMYMSNHPDTLVAYVKYFGKIKEHVVSAKMTTIDSKGMDLSYQTKGSAPGQLSVRVPFDPPLLGYDEVKPRLLGMTADANEALGMAKSPQVTTFHLPFAIWQTAALLTLLCYVSFAPKHDPSPLWTPARFLAQPILLNLSWGFVALAHSGEALWTVRLARKHRMPLTVAVSYVLTVFVFGYPVLFDLRRRIQTARIDSIMKGN